MIKARNKKLSLILVLAMVMTMFAGLGTAGAATGYSATHVPLVETDQPTTPQALGTLIVEYDLLPVDNIGTKNAFTIKLPADFEVANATPSIIKASGANINVLTPTAAAVVGYDIADNNIIVSVTNASIVEELKFGIDISAYVPSNAPSEITASILANPGSPFPDGRVTIAKTGAGKVDVIPDDPKTFTAATETPIQIKFRENKTNAIEEGNRTLKLKLPQGFEWANTTAALALVSTPYSIISGTRTDDRTLEFNRTTAGTAPGIWVLTNAAIQVDEDLAEFGDVYLTISGKSDVQPTMIPLGVYADYQAAISAVKPDTNVIAGRDEQQISNIEIKESIKGSLIAGRTVYLELPDGVKWRTTTTTSSEIEATVDKGDFTGTWSFTRLTNNASKAKLTIGGASTKNGAKLVIKDACVDIAVDYNGPITATVSGSAGLTGDVQVAEAVAPITATADAKDVKIGIQNQPGGNIIITETQADAITKGDLVLKTANNVNWAKIPTVKVIEGDLKLDEPSVKDNVLTIPVKVSSSKASKIEISDVFYTVDRTVPEGDMIVSIKGSALDVVNAKAEDNPVFKNRDTAAKVVTAKVVTPAPGDVANVAVFNYGETSYLLNGSPVQMDVAPYAKNNRTYVPVRYCANALGISDNNIIWNQQNKTVTMMKGDKVVQLTLGSNVMTINGVDIYMDVVVEAQNGRTFLPAAWVAQAFGAQAVWDPADPNTVVVKY